MEFPKFLAVLLCLMNLSHRAQAINYADEISNFVVKNPHIFHALYAAGGTAAIHQLYQANKNRQKLKVQIQKSLTHIKHAQRQFVSIFGNHLVLGDTVNMDFVQENTSSRGLFNLRQETTFDTFQNFLDSSDMKISAYGVKNQLNYSLLKLGYLNNIIHTASAYENYYQAESTGNRSQKSLLSLETNAARIKQYAIDQKMFVYDDIINHINTYHPDLFTSSRSKITQVLYNAEIQSILNTWETAERVAPRKMVYQHNNNRSILYPKYIDSPRVQYTEIQNKASSNQLVQLENYSKKIMAKKKQIEDFKNRTKTNLKSAGAMFALTMGMVLLETWSENQQEKKEKEKKKNGEIIDIDDYIGLTNEEIISRMDQRLTAEGQDKVVPVLDSVFRSYYNLINSRESLKIICEDLPGQVIDFSELSKFHLTDSCQIELIGF